ncbi:MAG: hypothetical protein EOM03_15780 [Clostridia bacterium]|nr:hypothetical protein [Clostridia bacterium]
MNLKKLVGLRMSEADHQRLRETAARLGCTQSQLLRAAIALAGTNDLTQELFLRAVADAKLKDKYPTIMGR